MIKKIMFSYLIFLSFFVIANPQSEIEKRSLKYSTDFDRWRWDGEQHLQINITCVLPGGVKHKYEPIFTNAYQIQPVTDGGYIVLRFDRIHFTAQGGDFVNKQMMGYKRLASNTCIEEIVALNSKLPKDKWQVRENPYKGREELLNFKKSNG